MIFQRPCLPIEPFGGLLSRQLFLLNLKIVIFRKPCFRLPITFLANEKLEAILEAISFKAEMSLELIFEMLYSSVRDQVTEKMDKKFYKFLAKSQSKQENKTFLRKLSQVSLSTKEFYAIIVSFHWQSHFSLSLKLAMKTILTCQLFCCYCLVKLS